MKQTPSRSLIVAFQNPHDVLNRIVMDSPVVVEATKVSKRKFAVGTKKYWVDKHDRLHRKNGKPAFVDSDGIALWAIHGWAHREDGPAIEASLMGKVWYKHGLLHRVDGPALILNDTKHWYVNGLFMHTLEEYCKTLGLDEHIRVLLQLKYGEISRD